LSASLRLECGQAVVEAGEAGGDALLVKGGADGVDGICVAGRLRRYIGLIGCGKLGILCLGRAKGRKSQEADTGAR
jgi:hypothetical protein